jgi:hypothetical protein
MPAPTMDATPMKAACGVEMNRRGASLTVAVYEAARPARHPRSTRSASGTTGGPAEGGGRHWTRTSDLLHVKHRGLCIVASARRCLED